MTCFTQNYKKMLSVSTPRSTRFSAVSTSPPSATQKVARQHLRLHLKRVRQREYAKLRAIVPSVAQKKAVSKITVIEEAVKYIDELHRALAERLQTREDFRGKSITEDNVKYFVQQLMTQQMVSPPPSSSSDASMFEKQRSVPSWQLYKPTRATSLFRKS